MRKRNYLLLSVMLLQFTVSLAGFIDGAYKYKGFMRRYSIYVPDIYGIKNIKVPLVLGLHGYGDNIDDFKTICMSGIADTANYICVYAEALPWLGANGWNSGAGVGILNVNSEVDDAGFLNGLLDTVISKYQIDTARMYVFGFSFGGFMTDRLAAQNSGRFAAVANVSGLRGNFVTALPSKGMPYLKIHGTNDPTIGYDGTQTIGIFPGFGLSAENTVKFWVTQNQCNPTPIIDTMPDLANDGLRFVRFSYSNGRDNSKVVFYKVINGLHRWYGLPSSDISYCQTIWNFFNQHTRQSMITALRNNAEKLQFRMYPNPSDGTITIDFSALKEKVNSLLIYDVAGSLVKTISVKNEQQIMLNLGLPHGLYMVQLITENGNAATDKLVIQ